VTGSPLAPVLPAQVFPHLIRRRAYSAHSLSQLLLCDVQGASPMGQFVVLAQADQRTIGLAAVFAAHRFLLKTILDDAAHLETEANPTWLRSSWSASRLQL
jgi:hypothetical protein